MYINNCYKSQYVVQFISFICRCFEAIFVFYLPLISFTFFYAISLFCASLSAIVVNTITQNILCYYHEVLPVVLYGCETWSLTLREERRLRVFENRVLRRVFGIKRDVLTGEWRGLHNEELNDLYSLPKIARVVKSRRMRWAGHVARMGEDRGAHRVLVGKSEGKRPLGRPRRRWEDNNKMDLQEVGGGRGDWMELAQDRDGWRSLVGTVRNFRVP